MRTAGPLPQSAVCRRHRKCRALSRARQAICRRTLFLVLRALPHRRTRKKFPCKSGEHSSAAQSEVNHTHAQKIFSTGEEKEIPAIRRTVWTKAINLRTRAEFLRTKPLRDAYAAASLCFLLGASSPSQRTLTSFDTPGSCIVTPYSTLPVSIVLRLCVTIINCVCPLIWPTNRVKRPTFASSSGASTSSKMQNGLG